MSNPTPAVDRARPPRTRRLAALAAASLLAVSAVACDDPATRSAAPATRPVASATNAPPAADGVASSTRVYDLRELVVPIDDFMPDGAELDAQGQAIAATPGPSPDEVLGNLADLIRESVDPTSWTSNGGVAGSIQELGGQLIVTQTAANQDEVGRLLERVARNRRVQVSVEGRFLRLGPQAVAGGDGPGDESGEIAALLSAAGPAGVFLDERQASLLTRAAQATEGRTLTAPRITLFDGQRAYTLIDTQQAYTAGYDAVKGDDGDVRFEPRLENVSSGVTFDVRATATPDRSAVRLVLNPVVKELVDLPDAPFPGGPEGANLVVQRPDVRVSRLSTTALVPAGKSALFALPATTAATPAAGPATRPAAPPAALYLLVRPTVIDSDVPEGA